MIQTCAEKGTVLQSTSLAWPALAGCSRVETFSQLSAISFAQPCILGARNTLQDGPTGIDRGNGYVSCLKIFLFFLFMTPTKQNTLISGVKFSWTSLNVLNVSTTPLEDGEYDLHGVEKEDGDDALEPRHKQRGRELLSPPAQQ